MVLIKTSASTIIITECKWIECEQKPSSSREVRHSQDSLKKLNSPPLKPVKVDTVCFDHSITLFWTFVFFPPLLTCLTGQQQGKTSKTGKLITGSTVALSPSSLLRQWATAGTDDKTWTPHRHGEIKVAGFLFLNYWTLAPLLLAAHLSLSLSASVSILYVLTKMCPYYCKMARTDGKKHRKLTFL